MIQHLDTLFNTLKNDLALLENNIGCERIQNRLLENLEQLGLLFIDSKTFKDVPEDVAIAYAHESIALTTAIHSLISFATGTAAAIH